MMKKRLLVFSVGLIWIGLAVILLWGSLVTAQGTDGLTPDEAQVVAQERLQTQAELGYAPEWEGASLGEVIYLYDLAGNVSAYLFPVWRDGESAGYLTVAALAIPNPVLEFSPNADPPLWAGQSVAEEAARDKGMALCTDRPFYVGPLSYGYELIPVGGCDADPGASACQVVDLLSVTILEIDVEQARVPLGQMVTSVSSLEAEVELEPLAYKLISGVPDYCQFQSGGCWSGCAPTASANVLGYWDAHGYPSLQSGGNWQQLVRDLGSCMSTNCGLTNIGNVSSGMINYARAKGYYFESELRWPSASYDFFRGEIDANHPIVVDLIDTAEYWGANHSVTGVGYQTSGSYMIVHDALACGANQGDHYIHYGSGYHSSIGMHPTEPDTTRPSKASNVRPSGWTGPYTNDNTPPFRWDVATDASGVKGYYVAVDDWTPEGGYGNDWWAGNVTAFTVPEAQSDGEHIFAVTSVDNAGNANPANTNQQGDAPYYTFIVDTVAPSSAVESLVEEQAGTSFTVHWSGSDATSGVTGYDVQYRDGLDGSWTTWRSDTTSTLATFSGQAGHTYYFRARACDRAGNIKDWPSGDGDTHTTPRLYECYLPLVFCGHRAVTPTPMPTPSPTMTPTPTSTPSPPSDAFPISTASESQGYPKVAYNPVRDEYLVIWQDTRNRNPTYRIDIYGQRVSAATGVLLGNDFQIAAGADDHNFGLVDVDVVYNPGQGEYLVVWRQMILGGDDYHTCARRVGGAGGLMGDAFAVSTANWQWGAKAACNTRNGEYLVGWSDERTGYSLDRRIYGQRLSATGQKLGGDLAISQVQDAQPSGPEVVYNQVTDDFLIVWRDGREIDTRSTDVYAQRVSAVGELLGGDIAVSTATGWQSAPAVAWDAQTGSYLIVWTDGRNGEEYDCDVYAQILSATGSPIGGNFAVEASASYSATAPDVSFNGQAGEYIVIWDRNRSAGHGQRVSPEGASVGDSFRLGESERWLAISEMGLSSYHLLVWGHPDVYGQFYAPPGIP